MRDIFIYIAREKKIIATKILVVDDDKAMSSLVRDTLVNKGYSVTVKGTAEEALQSIRANLPDLLILDVGLPGFSGLHLCEALKKDQATSSLLILMLTSQNQEAQKVHGLEAGADDYVTKPFSVREFNARIEALLRRQSRPVSTQQVLQGHGIVMRVDSHDVLVDGNKVALRPKEYALLELLLRRKDQVLSYAVIAESVWGDQRIVTSLNIKGLIHDLRGKLGPVGDKIEAIPHIGYKLLGD